MAQPHITVGIAGNPNSGKTTIFNNITGARQHVGNYPGVTVEKKEGACLHRGARLTIVDLPGTYSLTAYSVEELIARNYVIEEKPDVVVDVVDASNPERNLYLVSQFVEMGQPLVVALNMMDVAEARGMRIDLAELAELLGCPVVPMVGSRNKGTEELLDAVMSVAQQQLKVSPERVRYGREIEEEVGKIAAFVRSHCGDASPYPPRWTAVKLLEADQDVTDKVTQACAEPEALMQLVQRSAAHLERIFGDDPESLIVDRRYGFARGLCVASVTTQAEDRLTRSDKIDQIVCSRALGLPLFAVAMYIVFQLTFTLGSPPMEWLQAGFDWLARVVNAWWQTGADSPLRSLLVDGVIRGVGGVMVFLPNILLLFLGIAFLEDSGYMARAAFNVDRLMHKIGLHGKSAIPMLIGFGCSVPGIMATRTLDSRRDRLATMLVLPLMSCGARLPIYALIIPAFFPAQWRGRLLFIIYSVGIILAVAGAKLLRVTLLRGAPVPFVMELPPYRMPTLRGIVIHMWERSWLYIKKAGTIILGVSIVLWAATSYPKKPGLNTAYTAAIKAANADFWQSDTLLSPTDFIDAEDLIREIRKQGRKPEHSPGRRIRMLLAPSRWDDLVRPLLRGESAGAVLARALNDVIRQPGFYRPQDFEDVELSPEAKQLLAAGADKLARSQVQRLNRRLLEAAYPEHIAPMPAKCFADVAAEIGLGYGGVAALAHALEIERPELPQALRGTQSKATDEQRRMIESVVAIRDQIVASRTRFEQAVARAGAHAGEAAYVAHKLEYEQALTKLKQRNPQAYAAAVSLLDDVQARLARRLREISNERRAEAIQYSVAGRVGRKLEVVLRPLGFDWRIATALIGAFAAKEVFVAQLGIVFSLGEAAGESEGLRDRLRETYNPLVGLCVMLFCLISTPCMATVAVTRRETGSWGWALLQLGGLSALAYVVTLIVYQVGSLLNIGMG